MRVREDRDPAGFGDAQLGFRQQLGLGSINIGYTNTAMWFVYSYIWLFFMIVPLYGALGADP